MSITNSRRESRLRPDRADERARLGWLAQVARKATGSTMTGLGALLAAWRRRWAAEALYAALSGLSDADLQRRGLSRDQLYQWTREATGDAPQESRRDRQQRR